MRVQNPTRRGEIKEAKKVVRPIHQLPRLTASRTYFLASLREGGTWVAVWHFAGFMRPLRMVPGSVHLSLLLLVHITVPFPPPRPRLRTFCRVAITRQSPLPFGLLMDARCVGTGLPVGSMGCDRIHTRSTRLLLPCRKDTRPAFVNRPAVRQKEGFHLCTRAHTVENLLNESARAVSFVCTYFVLRQRCIIV